jgi:tetratricopeptide (TPR) repeat protein
MSDDRLRPLIDVMDVDGTEQRLRAALAAEESDAGRAEVLTQLARIESWRDRLDDACSLLDEADELAGEAGIARARVLLERGRIARQTDGDAAALALLARAYDCALAAGHHFVAADAAHSCALVGDMVEWTDRGLALADRCESASYWRGTLLINLGDWYWEQGAVEASLATFEAALAARALETRNPSLTEEARHGVGRALRALGRPDEALVFLEQVVAWVDATRFTWPEARAYREELAATYDDLGRRTDAEAVRDALDAER